MISVFASALRKRRTRESLSRSFIVFGHNTKKNSNRLVTFRLHSASVVMGLFKKIAKKNLKKND